jgi:hypothetical protein
MSEGCRPERELVDEGRNDGSCGSSVRERAGAEEASAEDGLASPVTDEEFLEEESDGVGDGGLACPGLT